MKKLFFILLLFIFNNSYSQLSIKEIDRIKYGSDNCSICDTVIINHENYEIIQYHNKTKLLGIFQNNLLIKIIETTTNLFGSQIHLYYTSNDQLIYCEEIVKTYDVVKENKTIDNNYEYESDSLSIKYISKTYYGLNKILKTKSNGNALLGNKKKYRNEDAFQFYKSVLINYNTNRKKYNLLFGIWKQPNDIRLEFSDLYLFKSKNNKLINTYKIKIDNGIVTGWDLHTNEQTKYHLDKIEEGEILSIHDNIIYTKSIK